MSAVEAQAGSTSGISKSGDGGWRERRGTWITAAFVATVTLIALGQVCGHAFLRWDDNTVFSENAHFNPATTDSIIYYWGHSAGDLYIPVTYTIWGVLAMYSEVRTEAGTQLDPRLFHAASLVFHIAAAIGVLLVLRRLRFSPWAAALGALIFAVHPLQTEAVAWAAGLKDVLSGGLCIWALWFYLRAVERVRWSKARWTNYLLGILLFVAALLSKPQAICLPLIILMIELLRAPEHWKNWAGALLPWFLLVIPIAAIGRTEQRAPDQADSTPLIDRPLVASDDLVFYVEKLFAPMDLTVDYGRSTQWLLRQGDAKSLLWFVLPAVIALVWLLRRRLMWLSIGAAVFVCALLPVLGFLPFDFQKYSNVSDHYVYLAMLGPALVGAYAWQAAQDRGWKIAAIGIGGVLVVLMATATFRQAGYWKDNFALFSRNLELQPDSFAANVQVGTHYSQAGQLDQALVLYRRALTVRPDDPEALYDQGNVLLREGLYAEAAASYRYALRLWPKRVELHMNLGIALTRLDEPDEAMAELETAHTLQPQNLAILMNLAKLAMQREEVARAIAYLSEALQMDRDYAPAREMLQQIQAMQQSPTP